MVFFGKSNTESIIDDTTSETSTTPNVDITKSVTEKDDNIPFREKMSPKKMRQEAEKVLKKYPDKVPVIVEIHKSSKIKLDKRKFLVPKDLTWGQLMFVIRRRIKLAPEHALFLFCHGTLIPTAQLVGSIYEEHEENGFLFATVSEENSFGGF